MTLSFSTSFLLFFVQQKISKRYPWKTDCFAYVFFLKNKAQINRSNTQQCFSCQNKSVCQKLTQCCKKASNYTCLDESLQLYSSQLCSYATEKSQFTVWFIHLSPFFHTFFAQYITHCRSVIHTFYKKSHTWSYMLSDLESHLWYVTCDHTFAFAWESKCINKTETETAITSGMDQVSQPFTT